MTATAGGQQNGKLKQSGFLRTTATLWPEIDFFYITEKSVSFSMVL